MDEKTPAESEGTPPASGLKITFHKSFTFTTRRSSDAGAAGGTAPSSGLPRLLLILAALALLAWLLRR